MAYEPIWTANPDKLNKFEFVKLEKDGLDVIRTIIEKYSVEGFDSIPADDMDRFKWAGVYQQKPKDGHFMSVLRYFLDVSKLSPDIFQYAGYADTRPASDNTTAQGRQKNRRVEITVLRQLRQ